MFYESPLGTILLEANEKGLTQLTFQLAPPDKKSLKKTPGSKHLEQVKKELDEYFAGKRKTFDVPLHLTRGTPFQKRVWEALQSIPYGQTRSYLELAKQVESPKAVRAVAQANKANPIALIIPCHRVIGKNGHLTGYMGACTKGLGLKKALLNLEQGVAPIKSIKK